VTTLAAIRAAVATRLALIAGSAPYTTSVGRRIAYGLDAVDADPAMAPAEASDGMAVVRVTATYSWEERI